MRRLGVADIDWMAFVPRIPSPGVSPQRWAEVRRWRNHGEELPSIHRCPRPLIDRTIFPPMAHTTTAWIRSPDNAPVEIPTTATMARPLPSLSLGFALLVRVAAAKGVSGPGFRSTMPALGTRPHICGGSTRRGRAPPEDPPRGSRGSLEPATSLMIGGAALSVSAETKRARSARETGPWGPTVGAARKDELGLVRLDFTRT